MKFNSSIGIDDDYFQSDDHYVLLNDDTKTIQIQVFRVRYGPGDDYKTLMDDVFSLDEFEQRQDLQALVKEWFGDHVLHELLAKIVELK